MEKTFRKFGLAVSTISALALLGGPVCALADDGKTATLDIQGMTCGACAASVRVVLKRLDGVTEAKISFTEKKALVAYDPAKVTPQKMADAINARLPYKAKVGVSREETKK
ncbi:MAG TPA: heavy metal-associated domain-containing protein [Thermoanaerobaculia bacterium]|jgi:copper chaperone CopZ